MLSTHLELARDESGSQHGEELFGRQARSVYAVQVYVSQDLLRYGMASRVSKYYLRTTCYPPLTTDRSLTTAPAPVWS